MLREMRIQSSPDPLSRLAKLTANLLQPRARTILNIPTRIHHLSNPPFNGLGEEQRLGQRRQQWILLYETSKEAFRLPRGRQQKLQIEKFAWLENLPLLHNLIKEWTRIRELLERWGSIGTQKGFGFRRLALLEANQRQISEGNNGGEKRTAKIGTHTPTKQSADGTELEDVQRVIACDWLSLPWGHTSDLAPEGIASTPSLIHRRRPVRRRRTELLPQAFPPQSSVGLNGLCEKWIEERKVVDGGRGSELSPDRFGEGKMGQQEQQYSQDHDTLDESEAQATDGIQPAHQ
jgi:hypothetical protein